MTAKVTTLKGTAIAGYYVDKLGRYYAAPGEPPGRWMGRGAVPSGLDGEVDVAEFENVMAGLDPSGMVVRGYRFGENSARAFDLTCSAPKSVSILWAMAPPAVREQILAAHDDAVAAVVELIDSQAVTRRTVRGETFVVDARGITAATFRQHTSRAADPQLHTHVVVSAKVQDETGRWLALDARGFKCDQRTWSATFHAALRSGMTSRLGVRWEQPVNGIAELSTIDADVRRAFSMRTEQTSRRLRVKLDRFVETMERQPTAREYWKLEREVVLDGRPRKAKLARKVEDLHARWRRQLLDLGIEPRQLVAESIAEPQATTLTAAGVGSVVDQAVAALAEAQSTWRRNDLIRELARAIPLGCAVPPEALPGWLSELADHTIIHRLVELAPVPPAGTPTRADGRPVTESTLDRRFTTRPILDQEAAIESCAYRRFAAGGGPGNVETGRLDRAQLDVARAVAGTAQLTLVVGPAGTGKTTALQPAVAAIQTGGRRVIGLAPSATAAAVLKEETGLANADTVDAWLLWMRDVRPRSSGGATTLLVDEASMLSTEKLAQLLAVADRHHCRVVLVGDPMQLSAVGRGGMFAHLAKTLPTVELEQVHRFTHAWERAASLAVRAGRTEALDAYDEHGRIHGGRPEQLEVEIVDRWQQLRREGSVCVLAATKDTVRRLNDEMQAFRLDEGELTGTGWHHPNGQTLYVGDHVATRRNDRTLRTDRGEMIRNRARWTVDAIDPDGAIAVTGKDGTVALPAEYVAEHLELAYAETIHAAQGRTVDHSLLLVDGPTDGAGVYVGLTRGRETNEAYVVAENEEPALEVLSEAIRRSWADRPAVEIQAELAAQQQTLGLDRGSSLGR